MTNPGTALRIAARTTADPEDAATSTAGLITTEVGGLHAQWRRTLETVKATLAGLEQACDSAIEAREAEATGAIETLVASAAAEASAAERAREQAVAELAELQRTSAQLQTKLQALQSDLAVERDAVKRLGAQLDIEVAARMRAEGERDDRQRQCQQQITAARQETESLRAEIQAQKLEVSQVRQQLEAAVAERAKLQETFRLVQRALALGTPEHISLAVEGGDSRAVESSARPLAPTVTVPDPTPTQAPPDAAPVVDATIALVNAHPEAVEDIARVVEQVEAMYQLDVDSGRSGIEIVDSLTTSLRHARSLVVNRWSSETFDAQPLFDHQIGLLLEQQAGTSFGRHLGIAAYASRTAAAGGDVPATS
jgi:hypothetical protein